MGNSCHNHIIVKLWQTIPFTNHPLLIIHELQGMGKVTTVRAKHNAATTLRSPKENNMDKNDCY